MKNVLPERRPARRRLALPRRERITRAARLQGLPGNLPRELTSFVGRQAQVEDVSLALRTAGLVTLTGTGGVGKTRLALRTAAAVRASYADGAWLVELAPLADSGRVAAAVADALGVRERPSEPTLDSLRVALRHRQILLVLDNCEHLLQSCAEVVAGLLQTCDGLAVLATSREPLGVPGEVVYPVAPLPVASEEEPLERLMECDAVRLLVARVQAAQPDFHLSPSTAPLAGRICRLVDGLPLGIELAASRARSMTLAEIATGLTRPLSLLTVGPRSAPRRQQTQRAAIEWSYALLTEPEARLFRQFSIFSGGCTFEGVQAVCAEPQSGRGELIDALDRLVGHSLVIADTRAEHTRFSMLETVRQYCLERLEQAGELRSLRERHRDWCLQLVAGSPPEAFDTAQVARLTPDLENLRAALAWALATKQVEAAARLALGLTDVWHLRGSFSEGRAALTAVLDLASEDPPSPGVAHAGTWASVMATNQGDYAEAELLLHRSVELARASGDADALLFAENQLGWVAFTRGNIAVARSAYERTYHVVSRSGGPFLLICQSQLILACIEQGESERALELLDSFPDAAASPRSALFVGRLLYARALLDEQAGDYTSADHLFQQAIAAQRAIDDQPGLLRALTLRGAVAAGHGDRHVAVAALAEALQIAELHASKLTMAHLLEALASLVLDTDLAACVRLAAAAEQLRTALGAAPAPSERERMGRYLEVAKRRMGEQAYAQLWLGAQAESLDAALDLARELLHRVANAPARPTIGKAAGPLSERERQVARLVTRGFNNREIADELVISMKTTEAHIHHVLNKLGLSNRVQIATWGLRHGIVPTEERAQAAG
jgi:non-specific serine/threonine protein kinase